MVTLNQNRNIVGILTNEKFYKNLYGLYRISSKNADFNPNKRGRCAYENKPLSHHVIFL